MIYGTNRQRLKKPTPLLFLTVLICLSGCYAGTVKPLLNSPGFKAENEPVRRLRVLLVTDGSYRKNEIEKYISKCSSLIEAQVGVRLEIVNWHPVRWINELKDIQRMIARVAADTWNERETFDVTVAPVYFDQKAGGSWVRMGSVDTFFWRYIFVKELDPNILLHEIFHSFLLDGEHSKDSVMMAGRPLYGKEWYWLTPAERNMILRNKWRDFNVMPLTGGEKETNGAGSWFYTGVGSLFLQQKETEEAIRLFSKSIEMNPGFAPAYVQRAKAYESKEDYEQALSDYGKAIEVDPNHATAYNNLAWLLASGDRADLRDGKRALDLALKACELSRWENSLYLDTLASAYARASQFRNAVKWQLKAMEAVTSVDEREKAEARKRLRLYRTGKPWPPD